MQYSNVTANARRAFRRALKSLTPLSAKYELVSQPAGSSTLATNVRRRARLFARKLFITAAEVEELKKCFISIFALSSLMLLFIGPLFFPNLFVQFCTSFFMVLLCVNASHVFKYTKSNYMIWKTVKNHIEQPNTAPFRNIHAIIVPNYCEPLQLLKDTVSRFASHPVASSNYVMVLAMEASEGDDALSKAQTLTAEFKHRFLDMVVSFHPHGLAGECAGKGANVAWAAKHVTSVLTPKYDANKVVLTVTDADALLSPLYFSEIEREMTAPSRPDLVFNPEFRMFAPPVFFARNSQSVPAFVRATDAAWSIGIMQNLSSSRGFNIPCSTYSVTLPLALHVGGWDPDRDALAEDMHMFLKCFYHTKGAARGTPIWAPVNLANVQDPNGYFPTLSARFTQACRHFAGSADSLYAMRHTFFPESQSVPAGLDGPWNNFFDRLLCLVDVLEAFVVPAFAWLSILAMPALKFLNPAAATSSPLLSVLAASMVLPYIGCGVQYELIHRFLEFSGVLTGSSPPTSYESVTLKALFMSSRTRLLRNILDYATLPVCAICYVATPATAHCSTVFRILFRASPVSFKYIVATKTVAGIDLYVDEASLELVQVVTSGALCTPGMVADDSNSVAADSSDEAICADLVPISATPSVDPIASKRRHIKHDSGVFALQETHAQGVEVVA